MSGENIYGLFAKSAAEQKQLSKSESPYTGVYDKHLTEREKPTYSTFFEKGKEYDGTNVRFFKQREAVIGKNVGDAVDPQNYLKKGGGIRHLVPTRHEEKTYRNPPLDRTSSPFGRGGEGGGGGGNGVGSGSGDGVSNAAGPLHGADGNLVSDARDSRGGDLSAGLGAEGTSGGGGDGSGQGGRGGGGGGNGQDYGGGLHGGDGATRDATKDFVASNIVEISNMVPKRRKLQEPLAASRKSFGAAPAYLSRVKGEIAEEKAFVRSIEEAKAQRQQQVYTKYVYLLPRDEHEKLVQSLRKRNEECVSELQKMPFSKDTATMRKRKTELEKTITDIETALKKLDKDALFIYRDDPVNGQWSKEAALKEAQRYAAHPT